MEWEGANPAAGAFAPNRVHLPAVAAATQILPGDNVAQVEGADDRNFSDNLRLDKGETEVVVLVRRCSGGNR